MDIFFRLCVAYRALNCLTISKKYLLPLIHELLDKTRGGKCLARLDLKNGYNLIRITIGDEWKTTFRTMERLFEDAVMPFSLTTACVLFQEMMDTIFKDMEGYICNLDDIIIYPGNTKAEHQVIVEEVLQQCVEHGLAASLLKSEFHVPETIFLSHVSNSQEAKIDPWKLKTMTKLPILIKKKEVQGFFVFATYYD